MLSITIPSSEFFNEETGEFFTVKGRALTLEHSLISLSKWESMYRKPFISTEAKTRKETLDYIKCMTLTPNVDPNVYLNISDTIIRQVMEYLEEPMTATWFGKAKSEQRKPRRKESVTAEVIYYWMISLNIPFECQTWHLNRLMTLIEVCNRKNQEAENPKKMSKGQLARRNSSLNAARRKASHSRG